MSVIEEEIYNLSNIVSFLLNIREVDRLKEEMYKEYREFKEKGVVHEYKELKEIVAEINGERKIIRKKLIHGRREKIHGADIAVEFPRRKIIFIQWKKLQKNGYFKIDRGQLLRLIKLCIELCGRECIRWYWYRFRHCFCSLFCPSIRASVYYVLDFLNEKRYIKVCDLAFILNHRVSIKDEEAESASIPENFFKDLLHKCKIGCRDLPEKIKEEILGTYSILTNRIVFLFTII